uniref:Uncharacterized protein n=1 Tax=Chlamydomonas euryale TaxID=1486919 RepID=A0A7R9Z456_9CHLO|mmetsp:Transcript_43745/g.131125  ORF Transcript_43745/g.131125 Transcript_43745/m.131125 type:complete len:127 (+) Transcript_43745:47-427(+)
MQAGGGLPGWGESNGTVGAAQKAVDAPSQASRLAARTDAICGGQPYNTTCDDTLCGRRGAAHFDGNSNPALACVVDGDGERPAPGTPRGVEPSCSVGKSESLKALQPRRRAWDAASRGCRPGLSAP